MFTTGQKVIVKNIIGYNNIVSFYIKEFFKSHRILFTNNLTHMTIWQGDWGAIRMSVAGLNIRMKVWPLSLTFNTVVVPMCTSALLPCTKGGCGVLLGKTTPSAQAASVVPGKPNNRPSKCLVTGFTQAAILILILTMIHIPCDHPTLLNTKVWPKDNTELG